MASQETKEIIPVIFAVDSNYVPMLHVTISSLLAHASPENDYHIHIMYEELTPELRQSFECYQRDNFHVECHNIAGAIKEYASTMHYKYYGSNAIYYRVFIPELFTQYDKVIYLDADVVLNADIAELYRYNLADNYIGGVLCEIVNNISVFVEYAKRYLGLQDYWPCYFNSGVLLMNCEKMRQTNFIKQFFEVASSFKLEICPDQDYYNLLCCGKTVILPGVWNKMPIPGGKLKLSEVKLVHFNVYGKPWRQKNVLYEELFWEHAAHTPVYKQLRQIQKENLAQSATDSKIAVLAKLAKELAVHDENLLAVIQKRNEAYKIPKKIHYIWVGDQPLSAKMQACINSWRQFCPDFEIIEWNEQNFDLDQCPLIKKALAKKQYALASDMMRVFILNQHGGIYLDTDVEILKPLDRFLQHEFFIGYECRYWVSTAIIGGVAGHPIFQELVRLCASENSLKISKRSSVHMWSAVLARNYGIRANGKTRLLDNGVGIYSREWFYPIHYITHRRKVLPNTHTIHYYAGMWEEQRKIRGLIRTFDWFISAPLYWAIEEMIARGYRRKMKKLLRKVQSVTGEAPDAE